MFERISRGISCSIACISKKCFLFRDPHLTYRKIVVCLNGLKLANLPLANIEEAGKHSLVRIAFKYSYNEM